MSPPVITVFVCHSCGHWAANSYFHTGNPSWVPRCKMKDGCDRPNMVPHTYVLAEAQP